MKYQQCRALMAFLQLAIELIKSMLCDALQHSSII
jgi:hypothetical protein